MKSICIFVLLLFALTACSNKDSQEQQEKQSHSREEAKARFDHGPFVKSTVGVGSGETIKTIVIPGKHGEFEDSICLIYSNAEYKQANMVCPTESAQ